MMLKLITLLAVLVGLGAFIYSPEELESQKTPTVLAQDPGTGQLAECYTCDTFPATGTLGFFGYENVITIKIEPTQDGKCSKSPGPNDPCDQETKNCEWKISGGGKMPAGYGLSGTNTHGPIKIMHTQPAGGMQTHTISGTVSGECGMLAGVQINITDEEGYVIAFKLLAVICDPCPD